MTTKNKKVDRRTLYTINVIKEAFLKILRQKPFNQMTIVEICRKAEITRSTFYLHFDSLSDLLNAIIDDALELSPSMVDQTPTSESLVPACQRLGESSKYQHLFMEPDLSEYIIGRVIQREKARMIPKIMHNMEVNEQDAETIFIYSIHGSFAINRKHHFQRTPQWQHDMELLNNIMKKDKG